MDIRVPPRHEIVVKDEPAGDTPPDPLPVAIHRAFAKAERALRELDRRQHGAVKKSQHHQTTALVSRLFADEGYGFLRTVDTQQEIYFHRNSVLHGAFDRLTVGTGVRFVASEGNKGLQASTVEIENR